PSKKLTSHCTSPWAESTLPNQVRFFLTRYRTGLALSIATRPWRPTAKDRQCSGNTNLWKLPHCLNYQIVNYFTSVSIRILELFPDFPAASRERERPEERGLLFFLRSLTLPARLPLLFAQGDPTRKPEKFSTMKPTLPS